MGEWIMQFFKYDHLPQHLQAVSKPFAELAEVINALPSNAERATALRKLLEAKDCAVRMMLFHLLVEALPNLLVAQIIRHSRGLAMPIFAINRVGLRIVADSRPTENTLGDERVEFRNFTSVHWSSP